MRDAGHISAGQRASASGREAAQVIGPSGPSVAVCTVAQAAWVSRSGVPAIGIEVDEPASRGGRQDFRTAVDASAVGGAPPVLLKKRQHVIGTIPRGQRDRDLREPPGDSVQVVTGEHLLRVVRQRHPQVVLERRPLRPPATFRHLGGPNTHILPVPMMKILNSASTDTSHYLLVTRVVWIHRGGTLRSVPRGDAVHRGSRPLGFSVPAGGRGSPRPSGLCWSALFSRSPGTWPARMGRPCRNLVWGWRRRWGRAVDQAADQAWASVMPTATRLPDRYVSPPAGSGGLAGTDCARARSSCGVHATPTVDSAHVSAHVSACSMPRRIRPARKMASARPALTTASSAHRRSGHSGTLIVVVPVRGSRR
jgi:hypothetical protein